MSNAVFPTLAGLTWDIKKVPEFSTKIQRSVNLSELRASFASQPVYTFSLAYDLLRDDATNNELKQLAGFFIARQGSFDSFLFTDPDDSTVAAQLFGTGDGATANFPLIRSYGAGNEPVSNVNAITSITVSNTPTSNYTLGSTGIITFNSPPSANAPLAWSGTFYYRCRFKEDTQEYVQFMRKLWEAQTVEFVGSLGVQI
jgi:uncharacterized protein (TIGR02217 family)